VTLKACARAINFICVASQKPHPALHPAHMLTLLHSSWCVCSQPQSELQECAQSGVERTNTAAASAWSLAGNWREWGHASALRCKGRVDVSLD
jgi:hypothetical protein